VKHSDYLRTENGYKSGKHEEEEEEEEPSKFKTFGFYVRKL
jgi:hypothetical protein